MRETRLDANRKTSEILDVSQLEVILLSTETVKSNIIDISIPTSELHVTG